MIGVGILGFNRPQYLRRLLASLEQQTALHDADVYLYLDGAIGKYSGTRYALEKDIDHCARLFARADLPNKWLIRHEQNVGIAINVHRAIGDLCAVYDNVMLLEDDVVLSPHWFRLAGILYESMPADAFGFSPGFKRIGTDAARMVTPRHHFFCDCFTAERWGRIRDTFEDFYTLFVADRDYYNRDDAAIRAWHKAHGLDEYVTSQDAARLTSIRVAGLKRYQCAVNRALYIGQNGIHFTPELYAQDGFANQGPFIFDEDATREAFVWDD